MYYVYVLQNPKNGALYYGFSADLKSRVERHQESEHPGWRLVYYEAYRDEKDARTRERMLKHYGSARGKLKARLQHSLKFEDLERAG